MLVKKANGEWRVCIDFTDLNKACPNDYFSLPHIDQLVDYLVTSPEGVNLIGPLLLVKGKLKFAIILPNYRRAHFNLLQNDENLSVSLDLIEELKNTI